MVNLVSDGCYTRLRTFDRRQLLFFSEATETAHRPRMHRPTLIAGRFHPPIDRSTTYGVSIRLRVLAVAAGRFPACLLTAQVTSNAEKFSPPTRTFRFTYNLAVKDIPAGVKRGRVWVLLAQTDQHQTVRVIAEQGSRQNADDPRTRLGNRMNYAEMLNSALGKAEFTLERKSRAGNARAAIRRNSSAKTTSLASCAPR